MRAVVLAAPLLMFAATESHPCSSTDPAVCHSINRKLLEEEHRRLMADPELYEEFQQHRRAEQHRTYVLALSRCESRRPCSEEEKEKLQQLIEETAAKLRQHMKGSGK